MTGHELRRLYLDFFRREGHTILPSASLVPEDPTLLFTSAGMVQFKDIFWGRVPPPHPRVTTCQKCFRTTDIERVGTTAYHHTFFEMLGNFSFGDYFKEGAIELAWLFLVRELALPADRLWVSVYEQDNEAYAIWRDTIGVPEGRIVRLGKEHNWWGPVGDRGPCGPDSEIYWEWDLPACTPGCGPSCDCGKFSEIWNLVFMQYDAQPDGTLRELGQKNIDTGMGLERMTAVLQRVRSNFDTDLFTPLVRRIEETARAKLPADRARSYRNALADHVRAVVFLIADGVLPDSEDSRGSVLRKVFIRAFRAADELGIPNQGLVTMVDAVAETFGATYPEIADRRPLVEKVVRAEEDTYRRRKESLERLLARLPRGTRTVGGKTAFAWYDSHGIPRDLIAAEASARGLAVDWDGFDRELAAQQTRSRQVHKTVAAETAGLSASPGAVVGRTAEFVGYEALEEEDDLALVLDREGKAHDRAGAGEWEFVFSARTPFYAEAGGQIADRGWIENLSRPGRAEVRDVQRSPAGTAHAVAVTEGEFRPGDRCRLTVDEPRRRATERAHTATHLLHAALRHVLGEHVIQAGSWVGPDELRFDFTHFAALTAADLAAVEELALAPVLHDLALKVEELPLDEARRRGAIAHFTEEYRGKERVRLVQVPGVSSELCGGTHVRRTGEIGLIVVVAEEAVAAGTRRLRALVGEAARRYLASLREERGQIASLLGVPAAEVLPGIRRLLQEAQALRRRVAALEEELASVRSQALASAAREVGGTKVASAIVDGGPEEAKRVADALAARLGQSVVVVGAREENKAVVVAKVRDEPRVSAGELVRIASEVLGGRGGGRPTFAQGGGPAVEALARALEQALTHAEARLRGA